MSTCSICGEPLKPEQKVCDTCGTSVPAAPSAGATATSPPPSPPPLVTPMPTNSASVTKPAPPGTRVCPLCSASYGAEYQDEFCRCGGELVAAPAAQTAVLPGPETFSPLAPEVVLASPTGGSRSARPPAGTVCLVVYSDQREPIHYHAIEKDVTIIGRSDPVRGDFPDLDLGAILDDATSRKVSRKHAMVLRSRTSGTCTLRPLAGNTGTQIEKEMAVQLQDYSLNTGTRLILGGVVRLKYEVMN